MRTDVLKIYLLLFRTIFKRQKFRIVFLSLLGFFNSALDVVSIGILIPLFSFIVKEADFGNNIVTRTTTFIFSSLHVPLNLWTLVGFMSVLFFAKAVGDFFVVYMRLRIVTDYENDTRIDLYQKTMSARWSYLLGQRIGYVENVLMTDVRGTEGLLKGICQIVPTLIGFLIYIIAAIKVSFLVTIVAMIFGGFLMLFSKPLIDRTRKLSKRIVEINKLIAHRVNESISGIKTIKATAVSPYVIAREAAIFEEIKRITRKSSFMQQLGIIVTEPMAFVFTAGVFIFSYTQPNFSLATFAVLMYLIQRIFNSVRKSQNSLHGMGQSLSYTHHVLGLYDSITKEQEEDLGRELFTFTDEFAFKNVSFAYNEEKPILRNIHFRIKKNEMVGVVGPSGVGKTTIADLILRLFDPQGGEILLDGRNINRIKLSELRKYIGYVSQDIFVMNDTVEANIRFFDASISEERIKEAARVAHCYDFVMALPDGFKTAIGERGVLLSGGQRQRIVLARILARKPAILILDEATSALDNESEALIQKAIEGLKGGITVIIIAHRLSTIMNSDQVIVLEEGAVKEQGTPAELLKDKETYFHRIYNIR